MTVAEACSGNVRGRCPGCDEHAGEDGFDHGKLWTIEVRVAMSVFERRWVNAPAR